VLRHDNVLDCVDPAMGSEFSEEEAVTPRVMKALIIFIRTLIKKKIKYVINFYATKS
jgi:hypothetical protein